MPVTTVKQARYGLIFARLNPSQPLKSNTQSQLRYLGLVFLGAVIGLGSPAEAPAQMRTLRVQIKVLSVSPAKVRIDLKLGAPTAVLSFRNAYADVLGLGNRIEQVEATTGGRTVPIRNLAPGEYKAAGVVDGLRYEVNLTEPRQQSQMSHVSWLNSEHGLLMLADLLPVPPNNSSATETSVGLELPARWMSAGNVPEKDSEYFTSDPEKAVFLVGPAVRRKTRRNGATELSVETAGKWPGSDGDVLNVAEKLIKEYTNLTGHVLKSNPVIMLLPFPGNAGPERWTAETRGNAVVLLLGNKTGGKRVLAKLGIVLSHEIFHLWVPNSLALEGDYDWFFEGFTLYQALRTAFRLKLISFETYLETIARVYDSYLSSDGLRLSLIEASERRWTNAGSLVYDKGMVAAFFYDLSLRSATDCQRSLDDVYRELFRRYATGQGSANKTIIPMLSEPAAMRSFARDYVEGNERIDLHSTLSLYGIQVRPSTGPGQKTKLELGSNLNLKQRNALRCLGYRG